MKIKDWKIDFSSIAWENKKMLRRTSQSQSNICAKHISGETSRFVKCFCRMTLTLVWHVSLPPWRKSNYRVDNGSFTVFGYYLVKIDTKTYVAYIWITRTRNTYITDAGFELLSSSVLKTKKECESNQKQKRRRQTSRKRNFGNIFLRKCCEKDLVGMSCKYVWDVLHKKGGSILNVSFCDIVTVVVKLRKITGKE